MQSSPLTATGSFASGILALNEFSVTSVTMQSVNRLISYT
jgi:hypothetical protein